MIQRTFGGGVSGGKQQSLEAPGFTPWFDVWTKLILNSIPTGTADHEFLRYHLGCIFVVSSGAKNPVEQLQVLTQQQYRHQHEKGGVNSHVGGGVYPQYLCTNILKYYVVIHDVFEVDDAAAQDMFIKIQTAFGSSSCHLLCVNSRTGHLIQSANKESDKMAQGDSETKNGNPGVADYWINYAQGYRFCNVETRFASIVGESTSNSKTATPKSKTVNSHNSIAANTTNDKLVPKTGDDSRNSHPLENNELNTDSSTDFVDVLDIGEGEVKPKKSLPALFPVTAANVALLLNSNDVDRIRAFIKEFAIKGLIPYLEKQMRTLQEIVTNRKSRSLFSGAKKWFSGAAASAGSKTGAGALLGGTGGSNVTGGGGTSVIYAREAPELQMRRLGDIYFMLKLYKLAYSCYHTAKRDFQSDEVWNYYAGAAEMAALSQFMQGSVANTGSTSNLSDGTKLSGSLNVGTGSNNIPTKYPAHYMEEAITKYLSVCQMPEFALRATLFDAICFKQQSMFQEAALSFIRMTNELKDLRSALLLEQAAYCYLLGPAPLIRKYAFHIILSGYRFSKSGQKFHSSRAYRQGFQIYKGHGWSLSEDHILYSLGHQSLLLKDHYTAANLFNELLSNTSARSISTSNKPVPFTFGGVTRPQANTNPLQQMCHLREFFIVHHMREKEDKQVAHITIPTFLAQECILDMTGHQGEKDSKSDLVKCSSYNLIQSSYDTLKKASGETFVDMKQPPRLELERVIEERISGRETLIAQTCQGVFGPCSDNTLPPQGVIGERIRFIIPAKNVFQTPLLLKKIRLIWKFTPIDILPKPDLSDKSNQSEENSDNATIHSEKITWLEEEKVLTTEIVESALIPSDDTVLIDLGLIPQQAGSLTIVGIQYAIKAQFSQTEATDYTIQGRQYLKVHGPRLMQTKDQRTNKDPVYNKDIRIGHPIEIIASDDQALPNLGVELRSWPDEIHQGEIRKMNLNITNLSLGQYASVNRIYLISKHPGMFATNTSQKDVRKPQMSGDGNDGLPFEFPVIADPTLSTTKDGSTQDISLDILPIDIEDDGFKHKKGSKSVTNMPLWVCGPSEVGRFNFTIYFYYECNKKAKKSFGKRRPLQYRMIRVDLSTVVLSSLSVQAIKSPACIHENDRSQPILVKVINSVSGNQTNSLKSIRVTNISLISRQNYSLKEILSSSENYASISKGESNVFCLKSIYNCSKIVSSQYRERNVDTTNTHKTMQFCISQILMPHVDSEGDQTDTTITSLRKSPNIDFVKSGFSFIEASKITNSKKGVELRKDILVVSWEGLSEKSKLNGQLFVRIEEEGKKDAPECYGDTVDSNRSQKSNVGSSNFLTAANYQSNTTDSESGDPTPAIPTPHIPCKINLKVSCRANLKVINC